MEILSYNKEEIVDTNIAVLWQHRCVAIRSSVNLQASFIAMIVN
jgi:hypothetical protein